MWDLPAMKLRGSRIVSRACDDLVGVAAALAAMQRLARSRTSMDVSTLITRGEEAGFVGTLAACAGKMLPPDACFVGIETSKEQPGAGLGDGVVIRVGDRSWLFDPALTGQIASVAAGLARRDRHFRYVRQLMPGGTCETTPLGVWGHRAAALCLPLANYHNQGEGGRIRAEAVDAGDFASLVKLLVGIGGSGEHADTARGKLKQRLEQLLNRREQLLEE
jgi:endoglucanase